MGRIRLTEQEEGWGSPIHTMLELTAVHLRGEGEHDAVLCPVCAAHRNGYRDGHAAGFREAIREVAEGTRQSTDEAVAG